MILSVKNASFGYGHQIVIDDVSFDFRQGEIVCILGPNGVGKTTLFRSIMGFVKPIKGDILLDDTPKSKLSNKQLANIISYVPQCQNSLFPFTVLDMVVMGRTSHLKMFETPGDKEYHFAERIMESMGISYLSNKMFDQISGGERQMVLIARALAQEPKLLMMDEPTANLDYGNQVRVLSCIRKLKKYGIGVVMTTHSPEQAFLCCDRAIIITKNKTIIEGGVNDVITEDNLRLAYNITVKILETKLEDGSILKSCIPTFKAI